tara:strand:- start:359 stop:580 length:222 start_codon:yes stop_codon:yes gene_type:complete
VLVEMDHHNQTHQEVHQKVLMEVFQQYFQYHLLAVVEVDQLIHLTKMEIQEDLVVVEVNLVVQELEEQEIVLR